MDTSTTVLDERIPLPFALSPTGAPRMFHHEGELAVGSLCPESVPQGATL